MKRIVTVALILCLLLPTFGLSETGQKNSTDISISDLSTEQVKDLLVRSVDRLVSEKVLDKDVAEVVLNAIEASKPKDAKNAAPNLSDYKKFEFKKYFREPNKYKGLKYKITGRVLQVMREEGLVALRIATDGDYGDVVLVFIIPAPKFNLIEDDKVELYCTAQGEFTYKSTLNAAITVPLLHVDEGTPIDIKD